MSRWHGRVVRAVRTLHRDFHTTAARLAIHRHDLGRPGFPRADDAAPFQGSGVPPVALRISAVMKLARGEARKT